MIYVCFYKDLKASLRKVEHETADLKFLNNQYIHKIRTLEKENKAKTEKIQQLQEKNLQAVVQTPGKISDCEAVQNYFCCIFKHHAIYLISDEVS